MNETPTNSGTVLKSYNMVTEVKWGEAQNEAENDNWKNGLLSTKNRWKSQESYQKERYGHGYMAQQLRAHMLL